jgi:uncharacterized protein with HEPN domain
MQFLSEKDKANLYGILESVESILNFSGEHHDLEDFYKDKKTFDAVLMNFIIVGEAISRLSENFKTENYQVPWNRIKGFRNIIAHDYFGVNPEIVWQIIHDEIPNFKEKIEQILLL